MVSEAVSRAADARSRQQKKPLRGQSYTEVNRFINAFDSLRWDGNQRAGRRIYSIMRQLELDETLAQDDAMGHVLYTAGLRPRQLFWCTACGGFFGATAQKLAKHCTGGYSKQPTIENLIKGVHPYEGVMLDTQPRRVTRRDAGISDWTGGGSPLSTVDNINGHDACTVELVTQSHDLGTSHLGTASTVSDTRPPCPYNALVDSCEEEDPLQLGFALD